MMSEELLTKKVFVASPPLPYTHACMHMCTDTHTHTHTQHTHAHACIHIHGIITEDSDMFLFGGQKVYSYSFSHNKNVESYTTSKTLRPD